MKHTLSNPSTRRIRSGFSLIELLVVVAIIVILAGITIGVMVRVNKKRDIDQTRTTLQMIRLKLEDYAAEHNGIYPVGQDATSSIVYKALSGDFTGQGNNPTEPVYWPELNEDRNPSLVGMFQGNRVILDGFGQSYRYRAARDQNGALVQNVRNDGDFDLWSIGPDGEPSDINTSGNLENEYTLDDIWN